MVQNILRRDQVERATGLPRSSLYAKIARNEFPAPIRLGPRAVGWLEGDIVAWQQARIDARDTGNRAA